MADWVQIKNPEQPKAPDVTVSVKAWLRVYKDKGWKLVTKEGK